MRLIAWNIRAGGGRRIEGIYRQILDWQPHVIVMSEFRGTHASRWLADALHEAGFVHQREPVRAGNLRQNGVFVASVFPLRVINHIHAPIEPNRWLMVSVQAPIRFVIGAMHVPNQFTGRKPAYHDAILRLATRLNKKPTILIGDTNSGRRDIDEENSVFNMRTDRWFVELAAAGFDDAFRYLHGNAREYTWYSPNHDNGFRLDQAFINSASSKNLTRVEHVWGSSEISARRDALSDHAALIVDLDLPPHGTN